MFKFPSVDWGDQPQKPTDLKQYELKRQEFKEKIIKVFDKKTGLLNLSGDKLDNLYIETIFENLPSDTKHLILKYCEIEVQGAAALSRILSSNTSLQSVNISDNGIETEGAKHIAEALKVNTSLKSVYISRNRIETEGAKHIAEALKVNTSLKSVDISHNRISPEGAKHIAEALKVNTSLKSVDISDNGIKTEGAKFIAEALKVNTSLESVDISDNGISPGEAKLIEDLLIKADTLFKSINTLRYIPGIGSTLLKKPIKYLKIPSRKPIEPEEQYELKRQEFKKKIIKVFNEKTGVLNLSGDKLDNRYIETIFDNLPSDTKHLILRDCGIEVQGAAALSRILSSNKSLQSIDISHNRISLGGAKHIAEALKVNTSLKSVDISDNGIETQGAIYIAEALMLNESLKSVYISDNGISLQGANYIADILKVDTLLKSVNILRDIPVIGGTLLKIPIVYKKIPPLKRIEPEEQYELKLQAFKEKIIKVFDKKTGVLDLSGDKLDNLYIETIFENLPSGTKHLILKNCGIEVEEAIALRYILSGNKSLQSVDISHNRIATEGAKHIAEALKVNTSLQSVDISHNRIATEGAKHIAEALKVNTSLQSVNISENRIATEGAKHIAEALKLNESLQSVDISDNGISPGEAKLIEDLLIKADTLFKSINTLRYIPGIGSALLKKPIEYLKIPSRKPIEPEEQYELKRQEFKEKIIKVFDKKTGVLDLSGNKLDNCYIETIFDNLPSGTKHLILKNCGIEVEEAIALRYILSGNKSLQSVDISHNRIATEGAKHIAEALKVNTSLKSVDISSTGILPEGAKHIAEALMLNESLQSVDISDNGIAPGGAKLIEDLLKADTLFKSINSLLYIPGIGSTLLKIPIEYLKIPLLKPVDLEQLSTVEVSGEEGSKEVGE